jgi:hypothetical protein
LTQRFNGDPFLAMSDLENEIGRMASSRFNEGQIAGILKEHEAGCAWP